MYAVIHPDCIGCGLCEQLCPAVFSVSGSTAVCTGDVLDADLPAASAARDSCPVAAIDLLYD